MQDLDVPPIDDEKKDYKKIIYNQKIKKTVENIKEVGLPKKNEQIRVVTQRQFNQVSFLKLITENETIDKAIFVIFAINKYATDILLKLIKEKKINNSIFIISSIRNAGKSIKDESSKKIINAGCKVYFLNSHAKIMALKTKDNYYIIEGSGNMSDNGRIEQYIFEESKEMFEHTDKWTKNIIKNMQNYHDFAEFN